MSVLRKELADKPPMTGSYTPRKGNFSDLVLRLKYLSPFIEAQENQ